MFEFENKQSDGREAEILFSRTVKAGHRIYYIDVKQNRRGQKYLSITESKKMLSGTPEAPAVSYEKHKIFLFPEDFEKFTEAFQQAASFAAGAEEESEGEGAGEAIKLDLDF